jgi:hypothetical protein
MSIIRQGFESADLDVPVVLPTLNLDFANSQSLDKRITFTRGSIGTRVNRNGLIETIPANQPRFDFDPISGECRGLLIEESRSNLFTYSDDAATAWGIKSGLTVSANTDIAPDGNQTMDTLVEDAARNDKYLERQITVNANQNITWSCYVKPLRRTNIFLIIYDGASYSNNVNFRYEFSNQTVAFSAAFGTGTFGSYSVVYVGNGVYRMVLSGQPTTSASTSVRIRIGFVNQSSTYTGTGVSAAAVWGAQVEAGAFPTSYIPTTASTVTRSADNASMTGTNFSSWFGSGSPSELSAFYSGLAPYVSINNAYYWQLTNTAITERILYRYAGLPQIIPYINGLSMGGVFANPSQNVNIKSVGLIDNKSFAIRSNDGTVDYSFSNSLKLPRIPTGLTQLNIGSSPFGVNYLNGTIRKLAFYPKRISSNQAVYLTQ